MNQSAVSKRPSFCGEQDRISKRNLCSGHLHVLRLLCEKELCE